MVLQQGGEGRGGVLDDDPALAPMADQLRRDLVETLGDQDELTPMPGVQESARAAERAYKAAGSPEKFRLLVQQNAGHEFTDQAQRTCVDWLVRWLKP